MTTALTVKEIIAIISSVIAFAGLYWKIKIDLAKISKDVYANKTNNEIKILEIEKNMIQTRSEIETHRIEIKQDLDRNRDDVKNDLTEFIHSNEAQHTGITDQLNIIITKLLNK
jgi:hypothetical protein